MTPNTIKLSEEARSELKSVASTSCVPLPRDDVVRLCVRLGFYSQNVADRIIDGRILKMPVTDAELQLTKKTAGEIKQDNA